MRPDYSRHPLSAERTVLWGSCRGGPEEEIDSLDEDFCADADPDLVDLQRCWLVSEYLMAFGAGWTFTWRAP